MRKLVNKFLWLCWWGWWGWHSVSRRIGWDADDVVYISVNCNHNLTRGPGATHALSAHLRVARASHVYPRAYPLLTCVSPVQYTHNNGCPCSFISIADSTQRWCTCSLAVLESYIVMLILLLSIGLSINYCATSINLSTWCPPIIQLASNGTRPASPLFKLQTRWTSRQDLQSNGLNKFWLQDVQPSLRFHLRKWSLNLGYFLHNCRRRASVSDVAVHGRLWNHLCGDLTSNTDHFETAEK